MLEVGRLANAKEDRTHFGAWVITSSPLILGFDLNDASTTDRVWDIITNTEAIAISQVWDGHPGRLAKSWNPSAGNSSALYIWADACEGDDSAQQGWAYDSSSQHLTLSDGSCVAPADGGKYLMPVACDGTDASQQWSFSASSESGTIKHVATGKCLDVYDFKGPVVQLYQCNGGSNQQFNLNKTRLVAGSGQCLGAKHGEPAGTSGFQLWVKPVGNGEVAALVINANLLQSAAVDLYFTDMGITGPMSVRDVWDHKDLGTHTTSLRTDTISPHDSRMYRFKPQQVRA